MLIYTWQFLVRLLAIDHADLMLDHALCIGIQTIDLVFVKSLRHATSTTKEWAVRIAQLWSSQRRLNRFFYLSILVAE